MTKVSFFCIKCHRKINSEAKIVTLKNGRKAYKGHCSKHNVDVYRITKG